MRQVDALLLVLVGLLAVVAFLNHGTLAVGASPSGANFGIGYGGR